MSHFYPEDCPKLVQLALLHVNDLFPAVDHVVYTATGRWLFIDESGDMPSFSEADIDLDLLERASDSVRGFPAVFALVTEEE